MSLEALRNRLPEYAKDQKLNLGSLATEPVLNQQQRAGTFVVSALASRNAEVIQAVVGEFGPQLSPEALNASKAAASIMGMNNIYYRFVHVMGDDAPYGQMPARLRMQVIGKPGAPHLDFELWCLAASAITGCEACVRAHEKSVREKGGTPEQVHEAVRIAAVLHAIALTLDAVAPPAPTPTAAAAPTA
jgi:alkyl hydroperoxide reductase subunit D